MSRTIDITIPPIAIFNCVFLSLKKKNSDSADQYGYCRKDQQKEITACVSSA